MTSPARNARWLGPLLDSRWWLRDIAGLALQARYAGGCGRSSANCFGFQ
jgi:hypothetical protein